MTALPTPLEEILDPMLEEKSVQVFVKRDDLIHPEIMGNKYRKLKYNLAEAQTRNAKGIVTFGGAYSNHIAATAAAAKEVNLESVGFIRGDELSPTSNPTLRFASAKGMELKFIARNAFRSLKSDFSAIKKQYQNYYMLPEGGTNALAIKGCSEIVPEIQIDFNMIVTAIGTGGTFCGLLASIENHQKVLGISCLKGEFIHNEINDMLQDYKIESRQYEIATDYHHGGYGQTSPDLITFINSFKSRFQLSLDPIYTGKVFFAVWDMIKKNRFQPQSKIVLLHSGGLQGIEGFNQKNENILR